MSCFVEPFIHTTNKIKVELNLGNYAIKSDLQEAKGIVTSKFAKEFYLANLKSDIDKLDIDKLGTTNVDLRKISNVVKNDNCTKNEGNCGFGHIYLRNP